MPKTFFDIRIVTVAGDPISEETLRIIIEDGIKYMQNTTPGYDLQMRIQKCKFQKRDVRKRTKKAEL